MQKSLSLDSTAASAFALILCFVLGCGSEQKVELPENPTAPPKGASLITSGGVTTPGEPNEGQQQQRPRQGQ